MQTRAICSTVEYTLIQADSLDILAKGGNPGDRSVLVELMSARVYYSPPIIAHYYEYLP